MYLQPPIKLLEDSISVMGVTFQLTNANQLIKSLRTKVAQQKELLAKARQELASQKLLKEKLHEQQKENEKLKKRLDDVNKAAGIGTPKHIAASPSPNIQAPGRLSLRSPIRQPSGALMKSGLSLARSPTASELYMRPSLERNWDHRRSDGYPPELAENQLLLQPVYATPEPMPRSHSMHPSKNFTGSYSQDQRSRIPRMAPSPRPVRRSTYPNDQYDYHRKHPQDMGEM